MTGIMQTFGYILMYLAHGFCVAERVGQGKWVGLFIGYCVHLGLAVKRAMVVHALNTLNFHVEIKRE